MCPEGTEVVIDVGADHGHVAFELGAVATERAPGRMGRPDVRWVVADGLRPFRRVDVVVIAGMGALTITGILERGPRPSVAAVLHAQDNPPRLRRWLAENGWRIDAEGLALDAGGIAEVLRAVPGVEPSGGLWLEFGPRLLESDDPLLVDHLVELRDRHLDLAEATAGRAPEKHAAFVARATFLDDRLAEVRKRGADGPNIG